MWFDIAYANLLSDLAAPGRAAFSLERTVVLNTDQRLECLRLAKELRPMGHTSAEQLIRDAATFEEYVSGRAKAEPKSVNQTETV